MRIITVIGARPQFIKAAALSRVLLEKQGIEEIIVHTGQHFDVSMSDVFFDEMSIPKPAYNLQINSLTHGAMTGRMLEKIEEVLLIEKPDMVLVYGDTNSTLAGALAAKKLHIKVGHVEAGLRSFNMKMPEEVNRILTDRISDVLFCPTSVARDNLKAEGFDNFECEVLIPGDVMQDAATFYAAKALKEEGVLGSLDLKPGFLLATLHRAENTDHEERLRSIIRAFNRIHADRQLVVPIHPRTRKKIAQLDVNIDFEIIDPVGYFDMIRLLSNCSLVLTDSGGLQKEAYFFHKPCVTLRDDTEWVELIEHGFNVLAGADEQQILESVKTMSSSTPDFSIQLYGGGKAANQIANYLATIG